MIQTVEPAKKLAGKLELPPDKSISHRAALFASIASEKSIIRNYSSAADPQSTLECLAGLGVSIKKNGSTVEIDGIGRDGFNTPRAPLNCGNSGTTMRLLAGIAAGAGIECELIGDESLSSRTMKRIIDPLAQMGCRIDADRGEYAPLKIGAHRGVKGILFPLPIASAQLKSCVLLAGLFGDDPTEVIEQKFSRDHTERLLDLKTEPYGTGKIIRSSRGDKIPAQNYAVPGDFSAAAFWLVAAAIFDDASIELKNTGMNPSRIAALTVLDEMGAGIIRKNHRDEGKEPVADLVAGPAELKGIELDSALVPNCIDELPILMVAMCFADGQSIITGAEELRHKETDRLAAMAEILTLAGADIELKQDGIIINGSRDFIPKPAAYPTWHDHRMAMASAVLAARSSGVSKIKDAECTAISYPEFWQHLQELNQ